MSAVATWLAAVSDAQQGSPDTGDGIAIIDGVVVAAVVVFALLVWLLSVARRRWRTRPDETHRYGDVGRIAGAGEASPEQRGGSADPRSTLPSQRAPSATVNPCPR